MTKETLFNVWGEVQDDGTMILTFTDYKEEDLLFSVDITPKQMTLLLEQWLIIASNRMELTNLLSKITRKQHEEDLPETKLRIMRDPN